jgi:hypothetical protein
VQFILIWTQDRVYEILYGRLIVKCVQTTAYEGFVRGKNTCGRFGYGICRILETITRLYVNTIGRIQSFFNKFQK